MGDVTHVNPEPIRLLDEHGFIPAIAPVGVGEGGESYNINADLVAGEVAAALQAEKLIHLTDVEGIKGTGGELISTLSQSGGPPPGQRRAIDGGHASEGRASPPGPRGRHRQGPHPGRPHPPRDLLEIFTKEGIGTEIVL